MKKLLIFGGTFNDVSIVEESHAIGIYTIVTDSHTDQNSSNSKSVYV